MAVTESGVLALQTNGYKLFIVREYFGVFELK